MSVLFTAGIYLIRTYQFLIFIRVLMSWFVRGSGHHPLVRLLFDLTEPILAPVRDALPRMNGALGMIDWSPLLVFFLLEIAEDLWIQVWVRWLF